MANVEVRRGQLVTVASKRQRLSALLARFLGLLVGEDRDFEPTLARAGPVPRSTTAVSGLGDELKLKDSRTKFPVDRVRLEPDLVIDTLLVWKPEAFCGIAESVEMRSHDKRSSRSQSRVC